MPDELLPVLPGDEVETIEQEWEVVELADLVAVESVMRRLAHLERDLDSAHQQAELWIARIHEWEASVAGPISARVGRLESILERFGLAHRALTGTATVRVPSGEIATRKGAGARAVVVDEGALLEWARENLGADDFERVVRTTLAVRIMELRKLVDVVVHADGSYSVVRDGVIVDGLGVEPPAEPSVTVRPFNAPPQLNP